MRDDDPAYPSNPNPTLFALSCRDRSLAGKSLPFHTHLIDSHCILQWGHGLDATFRHVHPSSIATSSGHEVTRHHAETLLGAKLP